MTAGSRSVNTTSGWNRSSTLDQHPEYRSLQAFFEAGVRPPTHQEAADIISQMFGARDLDDPRPAPR